MLEGNIAARFLAAVLIQPRVRKLLSTDHFTVDGTLIEAWASMKSFKPRDGSDEPPASGGRSSSRKKVDGNAFRLRQGFCRSLAYRVEMDVWDKDFLDLIETAHLTFKGATDGEITFGALKSFLDVRYGTRDGSACAEFSWEGNDGCGY